MNPNPKPPVLWSTVITRWAVLLLLTVALVIALRPTVGEWLAGPRKHDTSGDPADIRLVGVAPDGNDILLDPRGRLLPDVKLDWRGERTLTWSPQQMQRDFLFELGPGTEDLEFLPESAGVVRVAGNRGWTNPQIVRLEEERVNGPGGHRRILLRMTLNVNYWRRTSFFASAQRPLDEVDFDLQFYSSARGRAQINFDGPFLGGATNRPRESQPALVSALTNGPLASRDSAAFRVWKTGTGLWGLPLFAYDTNGKRHGTRTHVSTAGPFGWTNEFEVPGVPLSRVAAITVGEQPRVKAFHNVVVRYPERPRLDHSPILDRLAAALGQTNLAPAAVENYSPRSSQEAMTKLEFLPGNRTAMSRLAYAGSTTNFSELNPAQRAKLRQWAAAWADGTDPYNRQLGLRTGLRGGWPEFTSLALERLTNGLPQERLETASSLSSFSAGLGQEHLALLAVLARTNATPPLAPDLVHVILRIGGPAATNALLLLSRADPPVVWWSAMARLPADAFGLIPDLDGEMRQRLWMVQGLTNSLLTPADQAAARARLAGLLNLETRALSYPVFQDVLKAVAQRLDRRSATDVVLNYLRSGMPDDWRRYPPAEILRQLNSWHGMDFGGLGDGQKAGRSEYPAENAWPGIVEDVLEFGDKLKGKAGP